MVGEVRGDASDSSEFNIDTSSIKANLAVLGYSIKSEPNSFKSFAKIIFKRPVNLELSKLYFQHFKFKFKFKKHQNKIEMQDVLILE